MELVPVYVAVDEFMAVSVRDLLLQNGVPAVIKTAPGIEGYLSIIGGRAMYQGDVLVSPADEDRALELIGGFLGTLGELAEADEEPAPETP
jgi:hypothetical protein